MNPTQETQTDEHEHTAFFKRYYAEAVDELAQRYPDEQTSITIDWGDLFAYDMDVAEDYLVAPDTINGILQNALADYPIPNVELQNVEIRVIGLNDEDIYTPLEVTRDADGRDENYVGVRGELSKVTEPKKEIQEAAFECVRCGSMSYVPQTGDDFQEPHECQGCERQGPFQVVHSESTFRHHAKVRVETPADERGDLQNESIDGNVRGELVWSGGDDFGLLTRSGEPVVVYGTVEQEQITKGRSKTRHFEDYVDIKAIEFDADEDDIKIEEHREAFEELAARSDAVDVFAESIVPELHQTPEWEHALELLVAYLFAAPRIDVPNGPTYRGDIHALIVSDYGMGKSMVNSAVAMYSPKCIKESVTGMSSDVGLLAAATEDDFGDGQWTLKPGILVRANGGHVILDEIDKGPDDMESINDAIEGQQRVDVEKAGLSAEYNSRVGLLAMGNPKEGRFDPTQPVAPQLGVDSSFLSRFDGIITMEDTADEAIDEQIARQMGHGYAEANQLQFGDLEKEDFEALDSPVDAEVARAWIKEARENYNPIFKKELVDDIQEWYAREVRQLNNSFAEKGQGENMPVPATARVVMWVIRFSMAFARCRLRDEVTQDDVDRAMKLAKRLVSQNWDGEKFDPGQVESDTKPKSQKDRKERIYGVLSETEGMTPAEVAAQVSGVSETVASEELELLAKKGEALRPETGVYRKT